jgi:hypothetical protein
MGNQVTVYIRPEVQLPDNSNWTNRFEIGSETSDRVYVVSQNKTRRHWGCSCPSYRTRRRCKHLIALGLPCYEKPYEPRIEAK